MRINEEKLRAKLDAGGVSRLDMLKALAYERNNLAIMTLPTLGAFSHELNEREATARKKLDALEEDAVHNVPLLEKLMVERGWKTETQVCDGCGNHHAGRNTTCANCFEVDDD